MFLKTEVCIYDLARMRCRQQHLTLLDSGVSLSLYIVTSRTNRRLVHRAVLIVFPGIRQLCQHYC